MSNSIGSDAGSDDGVSGGALPADSHSPTLAVPSLPIAPSLPLSPTLSQLTTGDDIILALPLPLPRRSRSAPTPLPRKQWRLNK